VATIRADVAIDRTPGEVWDVVVDIGGLWRWMPGVDEASVVGDERVCVIGGGGGRLVERVLSHDDTTRR
jgi:carbon monoxide dehydrogenase subunit G